MVQIHLERRPEPDLKLELSGRVLGDSGPSEHIRAFGRVNVFERMIALTETEHVLRVPRGEYKYALVLVDLPIDVGPLDATGPTASLHFDVPASVHVSGTVAGSMRGPFVGEWLTFSSDGGRVFVQDFTDAAGRFELDVPARGPIEVRPEWEGAWRFLRIGSQRSLSPPIDPAEPTATYVIEEALLRVSEVPPSPLLDGFAFKLRRLDPERGSTIGVSPVALGDARSKELYVSPGRYRLERRIGPGRDLAVEVTVGVCEQRDVLLDCSSIAVMALDIVPAHPERRELRVRVRDTSGDSVDFQFVRRIRDEVYAYRRAVEPGTYSVEVASHERGSRSTDEPLDVWRGELTTVVGARAPVRVHTP